MRRILGFAVLVAAALAVASCGIFGDDYVRVRGSSEVHRESCPKVRKAARGGVVEADLGDGPPCYYCLRSDALEWAQDPD